MEERIFKSCVALWLLPIYSTILRRPSNQKYMLQVVIFFSAHGVPLAYVEEAGDPYKAEMEECVDLIMEELDKRSITNAYTLAYQVFFHLLIILSMLNYLCDLGNNTNIFW